MRKGLFLVLAGLWAGALAGFAQVGPEAMSITFQGTGPLITRPFVTQKSWHIVYQAKAGIRIKVTSTDGAFANVMTDSSNENSAAHSGKTDDIPRNGGFSLEVKSTDAWQITIVETGYTDNGPFATPAPVAASPAMMPTPPMLQPMAPRTQFQLVNSYSGSHETDRTGTFTVNDNWIIVWSARDRLRLTMSSSDETSEPVEITDYANCDKPGPSLGADMPPVPMPYSYSYGSYNNYSSSETRTYRSYSKQTQGGTYRLQVHCGAYWQILIYQIVQVSSDTTAMGSPGYANTNIAPTPTPPPPAPLVKLTEDQTRAVVLIKGDKAEGTGFLVKMPDGPAVVTNIHVISANPHVKITTNAGVDIPILSLKGASDRDLAVLAIKDAGFSYLDLAPDVSATAQTGDDVVTPGNSQGGEVMLNTGGKVQGIGPQRVEFDNPIYHGNSGGPVIHIKSGKVVGVVTEAMKVDVTNDLDKSSFQSRNSAISGSMRYFGLRLDTVPRWDVYDWKRFLNETQFLEEFHKESRCLDSYLNGGNEEGGANSEANLYLTDDKIRSANENYSQHVGSGVDNSQRIDALRVLLFDLNSVADNNVTAIQNMNNFYGFDQQRAQDEVAYRKALKAELDAIGNNVSRLSSLPHRTN